MIPLRRWWVLPVVLVALVAAWAAAVDASGRGFLPRHTSARDLPYALAHDAVGTEPFNRAMTDPMNLILPDQAFLKRELERGRLPLWNHGILGGVPHAANPITGTFYPPNLLLAFFDPIDFQLLSAALHLVLCGIFMHVFLLSAGVRATAALVGSLGFAFSGWVAAHLHNTPLVAVVAWIPLGLAGIEWIVSGRPKRGTIAVVLSIAMQWLAGFPQFAVIGTLTLATFAAVSVIAAPRPASFKGRAWLGGRVLVAALLGLMVAWVQIQPTLDVRGRAGRQGAPRTVLLAQTFELGTLTGVALPFWLGDAHEKPITEAPIEGDPDHEARHIAARLVMGRSVAGGPLEVPSIDSFGERALYVGGPILLLAIVGVLSLNRRAGFALLAAAVAASAFACGLLPPDSILGPLGLNVGAPGRAILVLALAVPAMAAFGLDRLLWFLEKRATGAWAALRVFGFVLGVLGASAAASAWIARDGALDAAIKLLRAWNAPALLGTTADLPDSVYAAKLAPAFDRLRADLLRLSLFALATWIALEWGRRAARGPRGPERALGLAAAAVALLTVLDLGWAFLRVNRPVAREGLFPPTPALELLHEEAGRSRFARVSADAAAAVGDMHVLLPPNMGMVHDLRDAQGYRDLVPPRTLRLLEGTSAMTSTGGAAGVGLPEAASPILDLMGVRWLIAARPLDESGDAFKKSGLVRHQPEGTASRPDAERLRDVVLYQNPDALPLAFAVHETVVSSDDEGLLALKSGTLDPRKRVILERPPENAAVVDRSETAADDVNYRFDRDAIRIDATLSTPGFVVISESWDPGWRATLWHGPWAEDRGRELDVLRADVGFMAVWVPAGRHTIELRYWPAALSVGIGVAGAGVLILLVLTVWPRRRPPPAEVPLGEAALGAPPDPGR